MPSHNLHHVVSMFSFQGTSELVCSRKSSSRTSFNKQGVLRSMCNPQFADVRASWRAKVDSNHRPHDYQSCALASWAIGPCLWLLGDFKRWWRLAGSNRWPPACKAGALPAELNPHIHSSVSQSVPSKLNNVNCSALRLQLCCIRQCASHPVLTLGHYVSLFHLTSSP